MMSIPPSEAKKLTWWEYQALLWNWNDRHKLEDEHPEAPDADHVAMRQKRLVASGFGRMIH